MDINKIKDAVLSNAPDEYIEAMILKIISEDSDTIPNILKILNNERKAKNEIVSNLNLLLSKADVVIKEPSLNKTGFVQDEISAFYENNKGVLSHCFKNE